MLKFYISHTAREGYHSLQSPPKENGWIRSDTITRHDISILAESYDVDESILEDVLDDDELPRVEIHGDVIYMFLRSARIGRRAGLITAPALFVACGSNFIDISRSPYHEQLRPVSPESPHQSNRPVGLMLHSFAATVSDYETLMQKSARYIHDTGRRLRTHEVTTEDFITFATVEDNLNEYRRNLGGMMVVAERIRAAFEARRDQEAVDDIILYIKQLIVAIESHNQSITSIRNAYSTIADTALNQRMKTLTVLTLLVALPNVIYGMYGMNVALPFQTAWWAYPAILLFTGMLLLVIYLLAKRFRLF